MDRVPINDDATMPARSVQTVTARPRAPHRPGVPWWAVVVAIAVLVLVVVDIGLNGPLDHLDHQIAQRTGAWNLRGHRATRWPLTVGVYFGQRGVVLVAAAVLAVGLTWRAGTCEPVLRLLTAVLSLAAVVYGFKFGLARNAPIQDIQGVPAGHGASFPSGHIANAILLWGLADWSVQTWPTPHRLRAVIRIGRFVAPVAVVVTMMLLNYHWLSDFIGGAAVGVILLAVALWPGWTQAAMAIDARWPRALNRQKNARRN
jgi:membrane-associated phospholipid phosphatase